MVLDRYAYINNMRINEQPVVVKQIESRPTPVLEGDAKLLTLSDRAPETGKILEVYRLSNYRRKTSRVLLLPYVEAELDRLLFDATELEIPKL